MLRHLSTDLLSMPLSARQSFTIVVIDTPITSFLMPSSAKASLVAYSAFLRSLSLNESVSIIIAPSGLQNLYCVASAAAFIATSRSHLSPGV